ncbi:MAG: hypothetical protein KGL39_37755 [Patescibacteria group bacterium]|nr:hypothetical protein [Patescibacteria group bacterium]
MANLALSHPASYAEVAAILGTRDSRRIGHNTTLRREAGGLIVRYHATDIVTFHPDDSATYANGGYVTVTTNQRLNALLPLALRVSQRARRLFVEGRETPSRPFVDGLTVDLTTARILSDAPDTSAEDTANRAAERAIQQFVKSLTDDRIRGIVADAQANGTAGDCWGCAFTAADGSYPMGETCLADHVAENYAHASLLVRAVKAAGYPNPAVLYSPDITRRAVRKLLRRAMLTNVAVR